MDILGDGPADELDRILRADTLTYLPEDLLVKMDRATMANSLEASVATARSRADRVRRAAPVASQDPSGSHQGRSFGRSLTGSCRASSSTAPRWASPFRWEPGSAVTSVTAIATLSWRPMRPSATSSTRLQPNDSSRNTARARSITRRGSGRSSCSSTGRAGGCRCKPCPDEDARHRRSRLHRAPPRPRTHRPGRRRGGPRRPIHRGPPATHGVRVPDPVARRRCP